VEVVAVEIAAIELDPPNSTIMVGESVQFVAKLLDRSGNVLNGRDVAWSSSDPDAAAVDETGLVNGVAPGTATITAASASWRATAAVTVNRPAPGLTSVQPSIGQRLQTLDLVLTGSNFAAGVTTVDLGGGITVDDVAVTAPNAATVRVTIGAGTQLGARNVSVTTPAPGGGTATLEAGFTVLAEHPSPTLTNVNPASGQRQMTLDVTLTGSGFMPGLTTVSFGADITVSAIDVVSPTSLKATIGIAPAAALGVRAVAVSNDPPGGGTATLAGGFTVLAANPVPALSGVSPTSGQRQTTLDVTLTGSGFMPGATTVSFGSRITVSDVSVASPTSLTARISIAADAALGARNVSVTNPGPGGGTATLAGGFTVLAANPTPAITGATPNAVQRKDRRDVSLTGSGFLPGVTTVSFGPDITVHEVQVNSPTSLVANISIGAGASLGTRSVSATNPAPGGGTGTLADGFTVLEENPAPTLTGAFPSSGLRGSTLNVTLVGSGFVQGLTSVNFGADIVVNSVNVVFWTSLTANITIAPGAATGMRSISVTNASPGGGTFIMHDGFSIF
jgi:hypothetical protein